MRVQIPRARTTGWKPRWFPQPNIPRSLGCTPPAHSMCTKTTTVLPSNLPHPPPIPERPSTNFGQMPPHPLHRCCCTPPLSRRRACTVRVPHTTGKHPMALWRAHRLNPNDCSTTRTCDCSAVLVEQQGSGVSCRKEEEEDWTFRKGVRGEMPLNSKRSKPHGKGARRRNKTVWSATRKRDQFGGDS